MRVASAAQTVIIWSVFDRKHLHILGDNKDFITSICFSPNGISLASGLMDNTVKIWNSVKGNCIKTLLGHNMTVCSVCYSSDGEILASGSWDKTVRLWNPANGECIQILQGHTNYVTSVCFNADGKIIASGSDDKSVKIWHSLKDFLTKKSAVLHHAAELSADERLKFITSDTVVSAKEKTNGCFYHLKYEIRNLESGFNCMGCVFEDCIAKGDQENVSVLQRIVEQGGGKLS
jgi:WD40 repeat protein